MPDSPQPLQQFRTIVFADPALQAELRQAPDRSSFVRLVMERAREHGWTLDATEVEAALAAGAREWALRGIAR
jgi:hypothetical protein